LLGGFYSREESNYNFSYMAEDSTTGAVIGQALHTNWRTSFSEYAAFTDLTYHATDRFDVQVGARQSHIMETYNESDEGPFVPLFDGVPSPLVRPQVDTNANAFTYLVTPRFRLSSDMMVYARLASGYRAGGPNAVYAGPGTPSHYNPDKTQSYEIGLKADFLDRTLSVDTSLYYIDWKDIQISLINPQTGITYNANGSQAKSQGVELSVESRPLTGLTIAGWVAWDEAVLTQAFPAASPTYGASGDRLPYSSRFSGNVTLEQDFPLGNRVTGFVGAAASYVGNRVGEFTGSPQRQDLPGYTKTDLRAGTKYDSWTVNVFVNNVADTRGVLNGGLGQFPPYGFVLIQPRTVGLSASRAF
jgi:outer membrane receptor protein involved in Fe transport